MVAPLLAGFLLVESLLLVTFLRVDSGTAKYVVWQVLLWLGVIAIAVGVRRYRPSMRLPWGLLAVGVGSLALSVLLDQLAGALAGQTGWELGSEVLAAVGYPLIAVGTARFARAQSAGRDHGPALDSVLVMVAFTTVLWESAIARHAVPTSTTQLSSVLVMTAAASWVAAMSLRFHLAGGRRSVSGWLLFGSAAVGAMGAATFAWFGTPAGAVVPVTSILWGMAIVLLGSCALHPSMRTLTEASDVEAAHVAARAVLPAAALMVPPAAIVIRLLRDGGTAVVATGASAVIGLLVVVRFVDLVLDRERAQAALRHRALHDPLTGLPNRQLLDERLKHALDRRPEQHGQTAVVFLDLDGFKTINDSLGHDAGDRLLVAVSERMAAVCRKGDTLARFAGDEFVVVLEDADADVASAFAARLRDAIRTPVPIDEGLVTVDASIGIAMSGTVGRDDERLLVAADNAMYAAKRYGRGRVEFATTDVLADVDRTSTPRRARLKTPTNSPT